MKTGFLVAVAHLFLGNAKAVTNQEEATKLLSPKVALNKAMAAVDTPDETKPDQQDTTVSSLELMKLEQFAHDMKDKYAAQGNGTDARLLRALQSDPDCSATSDGGVKCCQQESGANFCIYFYCPQQGQISDACTCGVQVNERFCNSCALCGDDMGFDCNNVQQGLASNVCPGAGSFAAATTAAPPQDGEPDCKEVGGGGLECCNVNDGTNVCITFYCSGDAITGDCGCRMSLDGRTCGQCDICEGGEDIHADCTNIGANALPVCPETTATATQEEGEPDCKAVSGGGVECCGVNDHGINVCITFYCSGDDLTGDCGCRMTLDGNTCGQCDVCEGGEQAFHADCTNIGANALPVCPETLSGSNSGTGSGGGNGFGTGTGNGGNSGSGNGSGTGTGTGGNSGSGNGFGTGAGTGGNSGSGNGFGTGTGTGGNSGSSGSSNGSGNGVGSSGGGTNSFPWGQGSGGSTSSAASVASRGLAVGSFVIGSAVISML